MKIWEIIVIIGLSSLAMVFILDSIPPKTPEELRASTYYDCVRYTYQQNPPMNDVDNCNKVK